MASITVRVFFSITFAYIWVCTSAAAKIEHISEASWNALNQSVGGRLGVVTPMALPCYVRYNNGSKTSIHRPDLAECTNTMQHKNDPNFIADHAGGFVTYNFASCVATGAGCPLSAFSPVDPISPASKVCSQGGMSSRYIDVKGVSDIQHGLQFAAKHGIPLVVKNTGHDYRGRSAAPFSLALWTRHIQPPLKIDQAFVPLGCSANAGPALTYGAGQGFQGIYEFVHQNGYMMIGGASATVGASGGWVTGGGHSFASTTYGLGVDNVLQMKVVLPNGKYITANRCQNQDVFFALRGGGGGTFGVITETTSRLHKPVPMQMALIAIGSLSLTARREFIDILVQNAEKFAADGWGGYLGPDVLNGRAYLISIVTPSLTLRQARKSMKPITDFASNLTGLNIPVSVNITTLKSGYWDYFNTPFVKAFDALNNVALAPSSRLIPRENFKGRRNQSTLTKTILELMDAGQPNPVVPFYILFAPPSSFTLPESDQPGGPGYASVTPAWRNSLWHIFLLAIWDPADPTASEAGSEAAAFQKASRAADPLRRITPTSGAYQNEADPFEPNAPESFWGRENHERLLEIKRNVDPQNIMTCYNCVGWDRSDERYSCYPNIG